MDNRGDWKEWGQHVLIEINRLHDGQTSIQGEQQVMNATLIQNTSSLQEHMRRTSLNEAEIKRIDDRVKPLEKHVLLFNTYLKFAIWVAGLPVGAYHVMKLVKEVVYWTK